MGIVLAERAAVVIRGGVWRLSAASQVVATFDTPASALAAALR